MNTSTGLHLLQDLIKSLFMISKTQNQGTQLCSPVTCRKVWRLLSGGQMVVPPCLLHAGYFFYEPIQTFLSF
jgi:hypothetical protein